MQQHVSVPSFGDSFFIRILRMYTSIEYIGFRPLIRGFFFYTSCGDFGERYDIVSVPSFGDSFFINSIEVIVDDTSCGFRPLIRGFFFYLRLRTIYVR